MYPNDLSYIKGLEDALKHKDRTTQINIWIELLEESPTDAGLRLSLKRAFPSDIFVIVGVWIRFVKKYPSVRAFRDELRSNLVSFESSFRLTVWSDLLIMKPEEKGLLRELRTELGYYDTAISTVLWEKMGETMLAIANCNVFTVARELPLVESIGNSCTITL